MLRVIGTSNVKCDTALLPHIQEPQAAVAPWCRSTEEQNGHEKRENNEGAAKEGNENRES